MLKKVCPCYKSFLLNKSDKNISKSGNKEFHTSIQNEKKRLKKLSVGQNNVLQSKLSNILLVLSEWFLIFNFNCSSVWLKVRKKKVVE